MTNSAQKAGANIGVAGSGYWGRNLIRNFHELGALGAICDSDEGVRDEARKAYPSVAVVTSFDDLLRTEGIDGVVIATPAETHGQLIRRGLEAGKDILSEKPLCLSSREGDQLVNLARQRGRVLMVGHLLWYHPAVLRLKELVDTGELGRIQYIYSNRLNLGKIRREENILWSFAPHDISVILGLLHEMPVSVQAQGGQYLHQRIADVTVSLLSFPSGVKAHIFVSWLHPFKEQKLVIVGDRKMAVFNDVEKTDKLVVYPHSIDWKNQVPVPTRAEGQVVKIDPAEPLRLECQHFLDCIRTRETPRTDGAEGLRVLSVLEECEAVLAKTVASASTPQPGAPPARESYFAHPSAFLDEGVEIGAGTSIWHVSHVLKGSKIGTNCRIGQNVVIGPRVTIGNGVKIQNNVSVYEGVTLEDHVFCGPSMVFTNVFNPRSEIVRMHELRPTLVKRGASLGANSTVMCGTTIGEYAFVGAGAVVTHDVPAHALVYGNPARLLGFMCTCGTKLPNRQGHVACPACGAEFERTGERVLQSAAALAGEAEP